LLGVHKEPIRLFICLDKEVYLGITLFVILTGFYVAKVSKGEA